MIGVLIVGFISGALFANGVPHFIKGITGEKHQTPFGKPSSAVRNVVWGWLNMIVAVLVWHLADMRFHPRATFVSVAIGVLLVGVSLADTWARRPNAAK